MRGFKFSLVLLVLFGIVGVIGMVLGIAVSELRVFPVQYVKPPALQLVDSYRLASDPEWAKRRQDNIDIAFADTTKMGKFENDQVFDSKFLDAQIDVPAGVFHPIEAEGGVLPLMNRHPALFKDRAVMEIGTGTGIVSVFAATLGAYKVVGTDISELAIAAGRSNASKVGVAEQVEFRLVPPSDMSAYSVLDAGEQFDLIISNPPYVLDLDAPEHNAAIESGDLGFSIIDGLNDRLTDDGMAVLYYGSKFYHETIVKYAKFKGYKVRNNLSMVLFPWEAEVLFNSYLQRLLKYQGLDQRAFEFDYEKDYALDVKFLGNRALRRGNIDYEPLFPGESRESFYPGWIVISKAD